jgi:hypothetical protein
MGGIDARDLQGFNRRGRGGKAQGFRPPIARAVVRRPKGDEGADRTELSFTAVRAAVASYKIRRWPWLSSPFRSWASIRAPASREKPVLSLSRATPLVGRGG